MDIIIKRYFYVCNYPGQVEALEAELALFYVIGNCCYVVVVRQEFRKKFLLVFAAEQTLF